MLAIGGWIFWTFIGFIIIALVYTVETKGKGELGWPFTWLAVGLACYIYFFQRETFWPWFQGLNWATVAMYVGLYLLAGIFWLFFKWNQYAKNQKKRFIEAYDNWEKGRSKPFKGEEEKFRLENVGRRQEMSNNYRPKVNDNKEQINSWIIFFPFSVIRYVFNNLLADFFEMLRDRLTGTLNSIAGSHFDKA